MTRMKNIKLCYIAYGVSLAITNKSLFPDEIQAWKYGPVIPGLYFTLKNEIPLIDLHYCLETSHKLKKSTEELLEDVFEVYGNYTAEELSELTHKEGTPWSLVHELGKSNTIPDLLIKAHYEEMLK